MRRNWKNRNQRASKKPRAYKNTLRARRERHQARHPNDMSHMTSNFATEFDVLKAKANKITAEHIIVNTKGETLVCGQSAGEAYELLYLYDRHDYVAAGSKASYYLYDRTDDGFNLMLTYTTTVRRIKKQADKRVSEPIADAFYIIDKTVPFDKVRLPQELTTGERYRKMQEFGRLSTTTVKDLKEECRVLGLKVSGKKADLIERIENHYALQGEEE